MGANKRGIQYLIHAKICIDQALKMASKGNDLATIGYLNQAMQWLLNADTVIIQKHLTHCVPKMVRDNRVNEAINELIKTYKYIPS